MIDGAELLADGVLVQVFDEEYLPVSALLVDKT